MTSFMDNLPSVFDFYILPVTNPDGYVYSWTTDRMWRKNRRPIGQSPAPASVPGYPGGFGGGWGGAGAGVQQQPQRCTAGVDPNRNFPAKFSQNQAKECSDSFKGRKCLFSD